VGKARHDEIVAIFQKHREKFRCCYDVARQQTPALKGNYSIEIVLKTDGTIKQVLPKKEASEIHDEGLDSCVFTVAKALQFSPNAEGKETTIPYQFGFTPGGGRLPGERLTPGPSPVRFTSGHKGIQQPTFPAKRVLAGHVPRSPGFKSGAGTDRPRPSPAQGGALWNSFLPNSGNEGALQTQGLGLNDLFLPRVDDGCETNRVVAATTRRKTSRRSAPSPIRFATVINPGLQAPPTWFQPGASVPFIAPRGSARRAPTTAR
jgi:hypothetical protein